MYKCTEKAMDWEDLEAFGYINEKEGSEEYKDKGRLNVFEQEVEAFYGRVDKFEQHWDDWIKMIHHISPFDVYEDDEILDMVECKDDVKKFREEYTAFVKDMLYLQVNYATLEEKAAFSLEQHDLDLWQQVDSDKYEEYKKYVDDLIAEWDEVRVHLNTI